VDALSYPGDRLEVIVVDDGSPHPIDDLVAPFRSSLDLTLIRQRNGGPAAARNTGAARARGRLLAFTDDDCRPTPDWLHHLAERLQDAPGVMAGGRTVNALRNNPYSAASQALLTYVYRQKNRDPDDAGFLTTNNMVVPRRGFLHLGGFDERFRTAEDRDFCARWLASGLRIVYEKRAVLYHAHRLTLRSFWHQHVAYGAGGHRLRQRGAPDESDLEPMPYYAGMLTYPYRTTTPGRAFVLSALIALSQVASIVGIAQAALSDRDPSDDGPPRAKPPAAPPAPPR
jgi:GT2 family glycosyltransferase